jgi:hypothetical protein
MATRRDFLTASLGAFATYALLAEVRRARAAPHAHAHAHDTDAWLARQDELAQSLSAGELSPTQWQTEIEALARRVDVGALRHALAGADLHDAGRGSANDPFKRNVSFKDDHGQKLRLHYGVALFEFSRDNVITPHGHRHMVSAHLVLEGKLRVRNFDRVADEEGAMILRATRDAHVRAGEISTMSSQRDNIHWFVPVSERAMTFDVVISDLDPGQPSFKIEAIDPLHAERLPDGTLRARIIDFDSASKIYTRSI